MRGAIIGAALAFSVTGAGALEDGNKFYSANTQLPFCKAAIGEGLQAANVPAADYCNGMLAMLVYLAPALADTPSCMQIPKAATLTQMARVVVRYVEARPQRMHEAFMELIIEAVHNAWPCKKISPPPSTLDATDSLRGFPGPYAHLRIDE